MQLEEGEVGEAEPAERARFDRCCWHAVLLALTPIQLRHGAAGGVVFTPAGSLAAIGSAAGRAAAPWLRVNGAHLAAGGDHRAPVPSFTTAAHLLRPLHQRPVVPEKPARLEPGCVTCGGWVEIAGT